MSAYMFLSVLLFPIFGSFLCHRCLCEGREGGEKGTEGGGGKCKRRKSTYSVDEFFTTISLAHMDIFAVI